MCFAYVPNNLSLYPYTKYRCEKRVRNTYLVRCCIQHSICNEDFWYDYPGDFSHLHHNLCYKQCIIIDNLLLCNYPLAYLQLLYNEAVFFLMKWEILEFSNRLDETQISQIPKKYNCLLRLKTDTQNGILIITKAVFLAIIVSLTQQYGHQREYRQKLSHVTFTCIHVNSRNGSSGQIF